MNLEAFSCHFSFHHGTLLETVQVGTKGALAQPGGARGEALVVGALGLRAVDGCIAVAHNPLQVMQILLG